MSDEPFPRLGWQRPVAPQETFPRITPPKPVGSRGEFPRLAPPPRVDPSTRACPACGARAGSVRWRKRNPLDVARTWALYAGDFVLHHTLFTAGGVRQYQSDIDDREGVSGFDSTFRLLTHTPRHFWRCRACKRRRSVL